MKWRIKTILAAFFFTCVASAQWKSHWEKKEIQCEVCGKTLYYNIKVEEGRFHTYDNMGISVFEGYQIFIADSAHCYSLSVNKSSGNICGECHDRYATIITDIEIMWGKFWDKAKMANAPNRKRNAGLRKKRDENEIYRQIEELQKRYREAVEGGDVK